LLSVSFGDQKQFEQAFSKVKKAVSSKTTLKDHNWMALTYGPKNRKYVLVGYPYTGITKDKRNDIMNEIVLRTKTDEIKGIVILGQILDKGH